jgi:hypothetical protein
LLHWIVSKVRSLRAALALTNRERYDANTRTSRFLQRGQDASAICGAVAGADAHRSYCVSKF